MFSFFYPCDKKLFNTIEKNCEFKITSPNEEAKVHLLGFILGTSSHFLVQDFVLNFITAFFRRNGLTGLNGLVTGRKSRDGMGDLDGQFQLTSNNISSNERSL